METFLYIVTFAMIALALLGAFIPILPSVIFSFLAALIAFFIPNSNISTGNLIFLSAFCLIVFVLDYIVPLFSTKILGGTKQGVKGATYGMIFGSIIVFTPFSVFFGGPFAFIICPFLGAFIWEIKAENGNFLLALLSAIGSIIGFMISIGLKVALALYILYVIYNQNF